MAKKREFGEGPIHIITNFIFWFFLSNLYFLLCILPFAFYIVLTFMTQDPIESFKDTSLILFLLSLLIGPSLTALYSTMGKLIREKDLDVTKDFFNYYRINFKQSFIIWSFQMIVDYLIYINIIFYSQYSFGDYIKYVIIVIGIIINIICMVSLPILSRFYFKFKDLIRCSFYFSVKKIHITILTILLSVFPLVIISYIPQAALFIFSAICYLIMMLFRQVVCEIEKMIENEKKSIEKEVI